MSPSAEITPTDEQQDIIDAARTEPESIMVEAFAGCTKSTTLQMAAPGIRTAALALAFNKKIAQDLQPRLPPNFTVKTFNALGHAAWAQGRAFLTLDDKKLGKIITAISKERRLNLNGDQWDQVRVLVTKVMQAGLSLGDEGKPLLADTADNWKAIALDNWISEDDFDFIYDTARLALEESVRQAKKGTISFDDQIYCPTILGGAFAPYPCVMVDESQDLSPLNHRMLELSCPQGRLIVVGDKKQAIYRFRGADAESMSKIAALRSSWINKPLHTTFRCPKVIVERNKAHAPGFKAWFTNPEGKAVKLPKSPNGDSKLRTEWTWQDFLDQLPHQHASIAILCKNNGPLFSMAFKLLRQQIGVTMMGRDIGKGLISLSKKICPKDETPADLVLGLIQDWRQREIDKLLANGKDELVAGIEDRAECLVAVLQGSDARGAGQLRLMLDKLFEDQAGLITLSSIHRFKGLERDCILHLDPWRIPSKYARGKPKELEQEMNLKYVCETRCKHTFVEANLEDFQ